MPTLAMKNGYIGQPGITDTTLYTCPPNTTARVIKCTVTNDTTTPTTISFNKVPSGGSVGVTNLITNLKVIGDKETLPVSDLEGHVLNAGYLISAVAGVADQLTVSLDVVEVTP